MKKLRPITRQEAANLLCTAAFDYFMALKEGKAKKPPPPKELASGWHYRLISCGLRDDKAQKHIRILWRRIYTLLRVDPTPDNWAQLESAVRRMVVNRTKYLLHRQRHLPRKNFAAVFLNPPVIGHFGRRAATIMSSSSDSTNCGDSSSNRSSANAPSSSFSSTDDDDDDDDCPLPRPLPSRTMATENIPPPSFSTTKGLRIGTWNPGTLAQGNAVTAVEIIVRNELHVLAVQETRLRADNERPPDLHRSFEFIGRARPTNADSRSNNHGGGVGWIINKGLRPQILTNKGGVEDGGERSWIRLNSNLGPLFLGCVYWRPGGLMKRNALNQLIAEVKELSMQGYVILAGDFNAEPMPTSAATATADHGALASNSPFLSSLLAETQLRFASDPTVPTHRQSEEKRARAIDHILASPSLLNRSDISCREGPRPNGFWIGHRPVWVTLQGVRLVDDDDASSGDPLPLRFRSKKLERRNVRLAFQETINRKLSANNASDDATATSSAAAVTMPNARNVDALAQNLHEAVLSAATEVLGPPRRRRSGNGRDEAPFRRGLPWWNKGLTKLRNERRARRRKWLESVGARDSTFGVNIPRQAKPPRLQERGEKV